MPQNKNALLRYRTIDRCLRNTARRWTLQDLIDACSDVLYDCEGKRGVVSTRTVQRDIEMMRSDKLGFDAPIQVYDRKYYRYEDPEYSIHTRPLSEGDIKTLNRTIILLRQFDEFDPSHAMADVINRLQDKIISAENRRVIIDFDRNFHLKGLEFLNPLYDVIVNQTVISVTYHPFTANKPMHLIVHPHRLKEYNNRWFLICTKVKKKYLMNLALDRIISFDPMPGITYRDNPRLTDDYYDDVIGVTKHERLQKTNIKFIAQEKRARYILTKPIHSSQRLVSVNPDNSMTFELQDVLINFELKTIFIGFGAGIKIIYPKTLADDIRDEHERAAHAYTNHRN